MFITKEGEQSGKITYWFCDDWCIFGKDEETKKWYCVSTKNWPEWINFSEEAKKDRDAVEKYMLPITKAKWDNLCWSCILN